MSFTFKCDLCRKEVQGGRKFSIEATEWDSSTVGGYGGIDEESICTSCRNQISNKVESMRKASPSK